RDAAEYAALTGDHRECERLTNEAFERTDTAIEKALLRQVAAQSTGLRGEYVETIQRTREALELLGVTLPDELSDTVLQRERDAAARALASHSDTDILDAPVMDAAIDRARLQLLVALGTAAWFAAPVLFMIASYRAVALTVRRGRAADSPFAFSL